jgi:phage shock protein C
MTDKRLMRSTKDRMIAGVCGGLGHYFGVDTTLVRVIFAVALFFGGMGPILYLILWFVMPQSTEY